MVLSEFLRAVVGTHQQRGIGCHVLVYAFWKNAFDVGHRFAPFAKALYAHQRLQDTCQKERLIVKPQHRLVGVSFPLQLE
jgi:hypothetical protein